MTDKLTLAICAPNTAAAAELVQQIERMSAPLGYSVFIVDPLTPMNYLAAAVLCDVVIVDGTIHDGEEHICKCLCNPYSVDHVLVVSRSYLPINFLPARRGGAPEYPYPYFDSALDVVRQQWSNEGITSWLNTHLREFASKGVRQKRQAWTNSPGRTIRKRVLV